MDNNFLSAEEFWHLYQQQERYRLLYGEWLIETEQEKQLRELAEIYHSICEAYDRYVCSGISPRTGEAIPVNEHELGLVNRYACEVRKKVMQAGMMHGLTERQVSDAIKRYAR